jgi:hypothetical protein
MPLLGVLMLGAQVLCAVHAGKTGRPYFWIMLILMLPGAGMLAYFVAEIAPEIVGGRRARSAASGVVKLLDPEKDYREALRNVEIADTTATRASLAEQCLRSGRTDEAMQLYRGLLTGMHETDPDLMLGLARSHFARAEFAEVQAILERLREANAAYRSSEGHLLYAQCLERQGEVEAALYEYAALAEYYPGQEAKSRYAALLQQAGRADEARRLFEDVRRAVDLMPKHARRMQREWADMAKRHLAGN